MQPTTSERYRRMSLRIKASMANPFMHRLRLAARAEGLHPLVCGGRRGMLLRSNSPTARSADAGSVPKQADLPRECVSVELTEQAAIKNLANAKQMVARISALGCMVALDDFGTGANSLTYLKTLRVSRVKIDGSFVRDI